MSSNKAQDSSNPPIGTPPNWSESQVIPAFGNRDRGLHGGAGYPKEPYGGRPDGGYVPLIFGGGYGQYKYYQQQQPRYAQQQGGAGSGSSTCLTACLGALCFCYTLDMVI
ncbi:hypothetical protein HYPBUDRAFT_152219 [Hyphopichia burtonii NRRL Y-1933]|uniref:Uncharacterized protein n=1 Tax=Hyphopichia burtonii NRRL Y-1933 TaxID=984485 RepID=A0A1E4RNZ1_9ASCO|nr:hypothetical protein HYPBUDRAFT_152219 [Hyphopichia burtonii NRRL Y-1933]ODV68977.1 hypothetical protein HYPBUDRAFT_152219 [Hyphopichia burtonii NRRL Y-1933]